MSHWLDLLFIFGIGAALVCGIGFVIYSAGKTLGRIDGEVKGLKVGEVVGFEAGWKARHKREPIPDYVINFEWPAGFLGRRDLTSSKDDNGDAVFPAPKAAVFAEREKELRALNDEVSRR